MTFEELNIDKQLLNALKDLGCETPTPIQEKAYPLILSGKDVIGIAQTGTGKTYAYLLPLLKQLKYSEQRTPRILIVVPTRELVVQVVGEIDKLCKYKSVRSLGIYGGANINTQKQLVYDGVDILVATPGRLVDLSSTGILRFATIQKLVIDEVDEMFDMGFRTQMTNIMELLPAKRQNLMFSATLTEEVELLIKTYFYNPQFIEIGIHGSPLHKIEQKVYHVPNFNTKINLLKLLLSNKEEFKKVIVFAPNKKAVDALAGELEYDFRDEISVIHSNKSQLQRFNSLRNFQDGTHRILMATDVAARGLDVTDVSHVINFDTPDMQENYMHRIGRTGRADKSGIAITFAKENEFAFITKIEELMNKAIPVEALPANLEISDVLIEEEKIPTLIFKKIHSVNNIKHSQGAFHEKKEKNKKVNTPRPKKSFDKKAKKKR